MLDWKLRLDRRLMESDVEAWTTGMLWNAASSITAPPSRPTFERWLARACASGRLRKVRNGLFLNAAGNKSVTPGPSVPNLSPVRTPLGEFRFRALPWHVYELDALEVTDWRDGRFAHPRATPEKALCAWLYLAASPRCPMRAPPLDLEAERLDAGRLQRVARAMSIKKHLDAWLQSKRAYDGDPEVIENASMHIKAAKRYS